MKYVVKVAALAAVYLSGMILSQGYDPVGSQVGTRFGFIDQNGKLRIPFQFDWAGPFHSGLAPAEKDGLYGYIDSAGNWQIEPTFEGTSPFSDGLARIRIGNHYGFINTSGKVMIPARYIVAGSFSEELAAVIGGEVFVFDPTDPNQKFGYIDRSGFVVIPPQFEAAGPFSEGLAPVKVRGKFGFINKLGELVIEARYSWAGRFSNGLAPVEGDAGQVYIDKTQRPVFHATVHHSAMSSLYLSSSEFSDGLAGSLDPDGQWRYFVPSGAQLFSIKAYRAGRFSQGRASVLLKKEGMAKFGYIDKTGHVVIEPTFEEAGEFSEGLAPVGINMALQQNSFWAWIDRAGQIVLTPRKDGVACVYAEPFSEGLALVSYSDRTYGFIDSSGTHVITPRFEHALSFSEGLAGVKVQDKYGFIERTGSFAISPIYLSVGQFAGGLAPVKLQERWGYIDALGRTVIDFRFESAEAFVGQWAEVTLDGRRGFVDRKGELIFAENPPRGQARLQPVRVGRLWGYSDQSGVLHVPPSFEEAYRHTSGLALVRTSTGYGFIDEMGTMVIQPTFMSAGPFSGSWAPASILRRRKGPARSHGLDFGMQPESEEAYSEPFRTELMWGYIDKLGRWVIEPRYYDASPFVNDRALVRVAPYR